jgi:transposase
MMSLSEDQYEVIRPLLPVQRGNVRIANLDVINAVLYVAENGCKWRALPERFGNWHTIYTRLRRWAAAGVLDRVFQALQEHRLIRIRVERVGLDSTSVTVHPDGTGARKSTARKRSASPAAAGTPRFIWLPRMTERP